MDRISENKPNFVYPRLLAGEIGEITRVAEYIGEPAPQFVARFLKSTTRSEGRAKLSDLSDAIWSELKNTDSVSIQKGDWEAVASAAAEGRRDWQNIRDKMQRGARLDAPIIVKLPNEYHLVSGNTRLMCARALGVVPKVLVVDLSY